MNILRAFSLHTVVALVAYSFFISGVNAQVQQIDKIVATVDSSVVLESELQARLDSIKARFIDQPQQLPPEEILREQVLEYLVSESLQLQIASRAGIYISDEEVSQSFTLVAEGQGLSPNQLLQQLSRDGQSVTSIMRDIRRELTLQAVQESQVNRRIFISESEVENFLKSAEGQFWQQPNLDLQHIQFMLNSNASPSDVSVAQNLAASVFEKLSAGEDFSSMAIQFSNSPTALDGGKIGWRRAIEFPTEIGAALEGAEEGAITQPIRSSGGIHIFKVVGIQGVNQEQMIQQTKTRHILIMPNEIRSLDESREIIEALRARILSGESFEDVAKENSEDISNSLRGGDLDWVYPGQMVPPFEQMMNDTAIGEVSPPVETTYGWHILKVDDRRDVDVSSDVMKNQARNVLRSQRFQEELDLWAREIRSDAFVSIMD